jgi:hypothetical protein
MDSVSVLPAPEIELAASDESPWERERRAFRRLLPSLRESHAGQYVAVYNGVVVASGSDPVVVALEAYQRVGYVPLYVGLVGDAPRRGVRLASPRVSRGTRRSWFGTSTSSRPTLC